MTLGAVDILGDDVSSGLVVTRTGYAAAELDAHPRIRQMESAHPVPDQRSLEAGAALVAFLERAPDTARFLFLVSGGASSLVELLPPGVDVKQLAAFNRGLLAGGFDIHAMNRARKAISRIKGGRLARWLRGRPATVLLISDVEGDAPAVIGSGPLFADPDRPSGPEDVPEAVRGLCPAAEPAPAADDPVFRSIDATVVATNRHALNAAAARAKQMGLPVYGDYPFVTEEAAAAGRSIAAELVAAPPGVHLRGGEPTVTLPDTPGRGGRMQALALAAADTLKGQDGVWLLAAGTDGADGPTEDAGALVDGGTAARGEATGLDLAGCLQRADAGTFLQASGDLIRTGGTGTNVMDLIIGLRNYPAEIGGHGGAR
jgi:hydroxypyruvate reductase